MARPALRWPADRDWMPARTCSATRDEVKKPRASTTSRKLGTLLRMGNMAGTTWYQRKICTSSGMLRKSSTQALPRRTSQGFGVVRSVPTTEPSTKATTQAQAATERVQPHADMSHSR